MTGSSRARGQAKIWQELESTDRGTEEYLIDPWGRGPVQGEVEETALAFRTYARRLTRRNCIIVAFGCLASTVVVWPTDLLVFDWGSEILRRFAGFRIGMLLLSVACYGTLRYTRVGRKHPTLVSIVAISGLAFDLGLTLGPLWRVEGGLESPWVYSTYLIPLLTVAFVVRWWERIAWTMGGSLLSLAAFRLGCPDFPIVEIYWGLPTVVLAFAFGVSILIGQIMFRVIRINFFQGLQLAERAGALEELDRLKSDFYANVSHELRTPLTLILAALRTLHAPYTGGRVSEDKQKQAAETGLRNASRLLLLVNDILELSRIESGQSQLKLDVYDLSELSRVVADSLQSGVNLDLDTTPGLLARVDGPRVKDVIYNLASNALKYIDEESGRVAIALRRDGDEAVIAVTDNGTGIDPKDQPFIFDRFYRGTTDTHRRDYGTGIGLAFVKQVVELHGGSVSLQSRLGEGACFTVRLPIGDVETTEPAAVASEGALGDFLRQTASRRAITASGELPTIPGGDKPDAALVLVADDHPDLRQYLYDLLHRDYRTALAVDGAEALELARKLSPDLILADVNMPNLSGPELLQAVRDEPALSGVPFVFLTASAAVDFQAEALDAGADDYLTKPFEERELLARVKNLVALKRSRDDQKRLVRSLKLMNERMAEQLRTRVEDLGVLIEDMDSIRDEERGRVARDVHDQLGELVTGMRLGVMLAQQRVDDPDGIRDALAELDNLLDRSLEGLNRTVHGLRPKNIEQMGLARSLSWLVEEFERREDVGLTVELRQPEQVDIPADRAEHVFRVVQESLTNVSRHARAKHVTIELAVDDRTLQVSVADDGVGMADPEAETERRGLIGLRERAALMAAELRIDSAPGEGTTVRLDVPL